MSKKELRKDAPKILGLDVSTKTIGWSLFDIESKTLLELTHISPKPKNNTENKIEELILKSTIFRKKVGGLCGTRNPKSNNRRTPLKFQ